MLDASERQTERKRKAKLVIPWLKLELLPRVEVAEGEKRRVLRVGQGRERERELETPVELFFFLAR